MSTSWQPQPTRIEGDPIPGTHLHRRYRVTEELSPEYRGPVPGRRAALIEATNQGLGSVTCAGRTYVRVDGVWYRINWPDRRTAH